MGQRTLLDRAAILAVPDITTEDVEVPEWGGVVRVRGLTASQRDKFEADSLQGKGRNTSVNLHNLRARLVATCLVGESGAPVFAERDIYELGQKSASAIDRIYDVATRLSGIGENDVEELTKNSGSDQGGDSSSD